MRYKKHVQFEHPFCVYELIYTIFNLLEINSLLLKKVYLTPNSLYRETCKLKPTN